MKSNRKKAFSLAESLVSMMLLVLAIMLTMTNITRKKFQTENKMTSTGVYACWEDKNNKLKQAQFENKKEANISPPTGGGCSFTMDRRVAKYYVIAVGSRRCEQENQDNCVDGEVKINNNLQPSGNQEEMKLEINLGEISDEKNNGKLKPTYTRVIHKDNNSEVIKAVGNIEQTDSGLYEWQEKEYYRCKVIKNSPCDSIKESECAYKDNAFKINCKGTNKKCQIIIGGEDDTLLRDLSSEKLYKGDCFEIQYPNGLMKSDVKIKVQTTNNNNPLFKAEKNSEIKKSPFVKFLKTIPSSKRNTLVEEIMRDYQDDSGTTRKHERKGVVLILW